MGLFWLIFDFIDRDLKAQKKEAELERARRAKKESEDYRSNSVDYNYVVGSHLSTFERMVGEKAMKIKPMNIGAEIDKYRHMEFRGNDASLSKIYKKW